ncbi:hypothetical protein TOPH_06616 [Tolypocladium ophioglossoides CBS 100239]|uniref:Tafazzin n=1 Tax=Tolypocladium ophioglossoides (strain CBS 100239) TaxID=1163406 RepID=A0A0L0N420_TOLOC|nr:hypothetical protein TOPH_06616 [Tolypocladium ophioglossoides CBS 100239]
MGVGILEAGSETPDWSIRPASRRRNKLRSLDSEHVKSFKPYPVASLAQSSASSATDKPAKGVNELLANLRHASISGSSSSPRPLPTAAPSVPPAIRQILQLPESPVLLPRRPVRQRFDGHGRRLPAGPAPPHSWVSRRPGDAIVEGQSSRSSRLSCSGSARTILPGAYVPAPGSLIDVVLRRLAFDWELHRVYNQYYLYFLPSHLKPALIRYVGVAAQQGVSLADLRAILLPSDDVYDEDELGDESVSNAQVTYLDLSGSIGRTLRLKDVSDLLFPSNQSPSSEVLQDSWDAADMVPNPPRILLPNLTHLSLALEPIGPHDASWKQLLALSTKLSTVTHLSLAFWPDPCLTPRARFSSVTSPQGQNISYGGTNYYSHSIDHDWSEALLVLRMLSKNLYKLEFLDLTGCAPWFKALKLVDGHDFVDWVGSWGKMTLLRLYTGWTPGEDALPSDRIAYREAVEMAGSIEKHIIAKRAGKGRFITVERNTMET